LKDSFAIVYFLIIVLKIGFRLASVTMDFIILKSVLIKNHPEQFQIKALLN